MSRTVMQKAVIPNGQRLQDASVASHEATGPCMFRLAHGQSTLQYLRANVAIVALEGNLKLSYCDHALAWLSGITPVWITVHEGERFVLPHRGIVSISAASAGETAFAVQPLPAQRRGPCAMLRAASRVSRLVRRLRRRSSQR